MAKILVQVPLSTGIPLQVEFPEHQMDEKGRLAKGKDGKPILFGERTCKGAIHLRPGSTKVLSSDELKHIRKAYPEVGRRLHVVNEISSKPSKPSKPFKPSKPTGRNEFVVPAESEPLVGVDDEIKSKGKK